jgi:hypothetical protein
MNSQSYFEIDPWTYAVSKIRDGLVGIVKAAAVQVVCPPGSLESTTAEWQVKLNDLLGQPAHHDEFRNSKAISTILQYDGHAIVRLFVDEGIGEPVSNFEIVGTDGLLVWKPDVCALSVVRTSTGQKASYEHPYADLLEKEVVQ